jgi:hypothetical protein
MLLDRFDRQRRAQGWNENALTSARIGVVGDDDRLASLFLMSAAALGIRDKVDSLRHILNGGKGLNVFYDVSSSPPLEAFSPVTE